MPPIRTRRTLPPSQRRGPMNRLTAATPSYQPLNRAERN
jgi:hypothetical protein